MKRSGTIGPARSRVKVPALFALLLFLALALPGPPHRVSRPILEWDVLVVLVERVEVEVAGVRRPRLLSFRMTEADRAAVGGELTAWRRRVEDATQGRLEVRTRVVSTSVPLTTLSGPGPYWIAPEDAAPLLRGLPHRGSPDTILLFARIGGDEGAAVPLRHLGGAVDAGEGPAGACFAAIGFRPRWLDGSGTVPLHEWLHGLAGRLRQRGEDFPDPDDGRRGATCCEDAPRGDSAYADHLLRRHLPDRALEALASRMTEWEDDPATIP